jgi:tetratricopeptide (TPR) repeat protein
MSRQTRAAFQHATRGISLHERGDYTTARQEFTAAYRLYASVDDQQGMIAILINLARTYRQVKNYPAAERELANVYMLQPDAQLLPRELLFEEAHLALAESNVPLARNKIALYLQGQAGDAKAAGHNLLAIIAQREGNQVVARQEATIALASVVNQHGVEAANAHRLLGNEDMKAGNASSAVVHLETALTIDRRNAAGRKIISDLRALAGAFGLQGKSDQRVLFLRHAREVAVANDDVISIQEINTLLSALDDKML